jgi:hypothetical protein
VENTYIGQLRKLGISSGRRKNNIKMVLKLLERDWVQESVQRLEDGMESPGFEYRQAKKGFSISPKRSYRL